MRITSLPLLLLLLEAASAQITREECEQQGGAVTGDIGNGAIFRPDYRCENDEPPTDIVIPAEGQPIAFEGEVCCGGTGEGLMYATDGMGDLPVNEGVFPIDGEGAGFPPISDEECVASGGVIIGATEEGTGLANDFVCDQSGQPPIGSVVPRQSQLAPSQGQGLQPVTVEGLFCCILSSNPIPVDSFPLPDPVEREEYSREDCLANNGTIVGDIGNGAIFQDDYLCESNNLPPIANIVQDQPPFAIEGEVCCGEAIPISTLPDPTGVQRDVISRTECTDQGGEVIGDTGAGETRAEDYVCSSDGQPPIADVVPVDDEPIAVEGEVCCAAATGREVITRVDCIERGGEVIADSGAGETQAEDYVCASDGQSPLANIVAVGEEVLQEICCATEDPDSAFGASSALALSITGLLASVLIQ